MQERLCIQLRSERSRFDSWSGKEMFLDPTEFIPALAYMHPNIQLLTRGSIPGNKVAGA
jgi:hypothetical protein